VDVCRAGPGDEEGLVAQGEAEGDADGEEGDEARFPDRGFIPAWQAAGS
jgi:hypothetical protein